MKPPRPAFIIGCVALLAAAGCGSSAAKDVSQTVARNAVALGMKKEFSDHHHALEGTPTCRTASVAGSTTKVKIICTATTDKGEKAALVGTTNGANEVRGSFTGTVNGAPVFTNDTCIGC
jgi:hypothetical protein